SARRWVWELLQNAEDVITDDGQIEINLTDSTVEFSHNGSPFQHSNLLAILSQRSIQGRIETNTSTATSSPLSLSIICSFFPAKSMNISSPATWSSFIEPFSLGCLRR